MSILLKSNFVRDIRKSPHQYCTQLTRRAEQAPLIAPTINQVPYGVRRRGAAFTARPNPPSLSLELERELSRVHPSKK
jgi:hypothetical protein